MFLARILAVLTILLSAHCADAGVIVNQSAGIDVHATSSMSVLTEWVASQHDDESFPQVNEGGELLSNIAVLGSQVDCGQAFACFGAALSTYPSPTGQIALENAVLPKSPVLDGLLKPS